MTARIAFVALALPLLVVPVPPAASAQGPTLVALWWPASAEVPLPEGGRLVAHHAPTRLAFVEVPPGARAPVRAWPDVPAAAAAVGDDPLFPAQWALPATRATEAWTRTTPAVLVAVVDSGVSPHEDLDGARLRAGFDHVERDARPDDASGHGTHVAGIIGATRGNGVGIAGVSWAPIVAFRVLDEKDQGSCANVALAVLQAADAGARVINLSLWCAGDFPPLRAAIAYARLQGAVVVAASGNLRLSDEASCPTYPARYPDVLAVGAVAETMELSATSCGGEGLDLVAPGQRVLSLAPGNGYTERTGTSAAAPHVTAAAALIMGARPDLTPREVEGLLRTTAQDLGPPGKDGDFGWGLLDVAAALDAAASR